MPPRLSRALSIEDEKALDRMLDDDREYSVHEIDQTENDDE